jgi:hypothetical protein
MQAHNQSKPSKSGTDDKAGRHALYGGAITVINFIRQHQSVSTATTIISAPVWLASGTYYYWHSTKFGAERVRNRV